MIFLLDNNEFMNVFRDVFSKTNNAIVDREDENPKLASKFKGCKNNNINFSNKERSENEKN